MFRLVFIFLLGFSLTVVHAQAVSSAQILSGSQVEKLFTDSLKITFKIEFSIFRVYKYSDKSGQHYCVLTESRDSIDNVPDTFNRKIKAYGLKIDKNKLSKDWELIDYLVKDERDENNIWFWTKYCEFTDFDKDSLIDPIIVYGTFGMNGYGDGRIKFIIYYKGKKIAIRHQNGTLDFERNTDVDRSFYLLPASLQLSVKRKMIEMEKNDHANFPHGWEKAMAKKKTHFDELKNYESLK